MVRSPRTTTNQDKHRNRDESVPTGRYQALCADPFRDAAQQEESMQRPCLIRIVRLALRVSLAAAFLSAVADRFGWWAPFGQGAWGSMRAFAAYTHQLVPFASGWFLTVIVWGATATEVSLSVLLLAGWRPKLVGAATCLVLLVFGTAMAVSLGMESPLSYSVFSAASAAAAYAVIDPTSPSNAIETRHHRRTTQSGSSKPAQAE
jgi:uncharacterized membrane protein YphA (DoxX/SURF4 family)